MELYNRAARLIYTPVWIPITRPDLRRLCHGHVFEPTRLKSWKGKIKDLALEV